MAFLVGAASKSLATIVCLRSFSAPYDGKTVAVQSNSWIVLFLYVCR